MFETYILCGLIYTSTAEPVPQWWECTGTSMVFVAP